MLSNLNNTTQNLERLRIYHLYDISEIHKQIDVCSFYLFVFTVHRSLNICYIQYVMVIVMKWPLQ